MTDSMAVGGMSGSTLTLTATYRGELVRGDLDADRCLVLLNMLHRFAWNSYQTVVSIAGDIPRRGGGILIRAQKPLKQ